MATNAQPMLWRDAMKAGVRRSGAMIGATLLFVAMIVVAVALASYSPADPSFSTAAGGPLAAMLAARSFAPPSAEPSVTRLIRPSS